MECITSPALDDAKIISYVEGEADEPVRNHINACLFCSERASRWAFLQNRLRKQLYRISCPASMELGEYRLGLLPAPQGLLVAQHVRECPLCRREVETLEAFLAEPDRSDGLLGKTEVLIARLTGTVAGGSPPAFAALRGEAKGPLTLEADGLVILLDIQQADGGMFNILGQVAAVDQDLWTGAAVELHQEGKLEFSTTIDDLGAFFSEGIMPGSKELRISPMDHSLSVVSYFEVST